MEIHQRIKNAFKLAGLKSFSIDFKHFSKQGDYYIYKVDISLFEFLNKYDKMDHDLVLNKLKKAKEYCIKMIKVIEIYFNVTRKSYPECAEVYIKVKYLKGDINDRTSKTLARTT